MRAVDLIQKKRDGQELTSNEIKWLVEGYVAGTVPDYQMSAFAMAVYFKGMTTREISDLTMNMVKTGQEFDLSAIDGVKVRPEELQPKAEVAESSTAAPQGEIPEGTVLGNGKIDFVLARIDTRLLHGQVATNWTKATHPNRIIVVSDSVSKDELRKKLIEQAAPPGVRAHVIPLDKLVQVYNDPRFGDTKALLLFETPQDALAVIEKGVEIPELNIGSMAHSVGKVQINNVLSLDQEDVEVYKKLRDLGVKFDVRKVSNDSPSDLFKLIEAKSSEGLKL